MSQQWQVGKHCTTISEDNGVSRVTYHRTAVVKWTDTKIILNSGGWHTATTKTRMNQAANQFGLEFGVFQKNFNWFVDWKGETLDFHDGMELAR